MEFAPGAKAELKQGTPLDWPVALLMLMMLVSLWATFDVRFSLPKVVGLVLSVAAYYVTVASLRDEQRLVRVVALYFGMGTAVAMLGLLGTNWLFKNPLLSSVVDSLPRLIRGLPGAAEGFHPNEVAGVLLWIAPLQWALLAWVWKQNLGASRAGVLLFLSTLCTTGTLLLTQSRGAFLGLGVWLAVLGAALDRRLRIGLTLVAVAGLAFVALKGPGWVDATLRLGLAPRVLGSLNWDFRVSVWRQALRGIQDFPLTGMGMGTFRHSVRVFYPLSVIPTYDIAHAHNAFLQAALDVGLPGLAAYVAIWLLIAREIVSCLRRARGWLRALALGLSGCLVSCFVYSLLDAVALGAKPGFLWWMMLGMIVGLERLCQVRVMVELTPSGAET